MRLAPGREPPRDAGPVDGRQSTNNHLVRSRAILYACPDRPEPERRTLPDAHRRRVRDAPGRGAPSAPPQRPSGLRRAGTAALPATGRGDLDDAPRAGDHRATLLRLPGRASGRGAGGHLARGPRRARGRDRRRHPHPERTAADLASRNRDRRRHPEPESRSSGPTDEDETDDEELDERRPGPQAFFLEVTEPRGARPTQEWLFTNELVRKQRPRRRGRSCPSRPSAVRLAGVSPARPTTQRRPRASLRTSRAAFRPFAPVTPPPGCVPAPQRYSPRIGVR